MNLYNYVYIISVIWEYFKAYDCKPIIIKEI